MAYALPPYKTIILADNCSGTPDYWTNNNNATHSYALNILSVVDGDITQSGFVNSATFSLATRMLLIQTQIQFTAVAGTGTFAGLVQTVDTAAGFNPWFQLGYDTAGGKFAYFNGASVVDLNTAFATSTNYFLDILIDPIAGLWNIYINGTLDTANIAALAGATIANLKTFILGGGSSGKTWTMHLNEFNVTQLQPPNNLSMLGVG